MRAQFGVGERVNVPSDTRIQGVILSLAGDVENGFFYVLGWVSSEGLSAQDRFSQKALSDANQPPPDHTGEIAALRKIITDAQGTITAQERSIHRLRASRKSRRRR